MAQNKKKKVIRKRLPTKRAPQKAVENIQGVRGATAQRLRKAGYGTITELAQANPDGLAEKTGLNKTLAKKLISAAGNIYKEASAEQPSVKGQTGIKEKQIVKGKIIAEVMKNEEFRCRVVYYVVDKMF